MTAQPCRPVVAGKQRGVVLLITLLVLVAMMLASVGMMRSVDTSVMAAGNIAFRQSAEATANTAIETAFRDLVNDAVGAALVGNLVNDVTGSGYFATFSPTNDDSRGVPRRLIDQTDGVVFTDPASGNTTRTIIERMCTAIGEPVFPGCLTATGAGGGSFQNNVGLGNELEKDLEPAPGAGSGIGRILYRISVRVDGPNGTVTYAQAMVAR